MPTGCCGDDPTRGTVYGILTTLAYSGFILVLRQTNADLRRPAGPLGRDGEQQLADRRGVASHHLPHDAETAAAELEAASWRAAGDLRQRQLQHARRDGVPLGNIAPHPVGTVSAAQEAAFTNARLRWEQVITGDLPNVQMNIPAGACKDAEGEALVDHPAVNEVIDDLLVYVQVDSIDGPGKVLGSAGPCYIRNTSRLPVFGIMRFDRADLTLMAQNGILGDVILHELGHVLGFPTIWSDPQFDLLQDTATSDPYYSGAKGLSAFQLAGGTPVNGVGVPVENTGGEGTRLSHWREAVLATELMTGFISAGNNPLSAITMVGTTGQGYTDGLRFVQFYFGLPLAMVLISAVFVPIYYRLKVYTAYEFLEQRFDLKALGPNNPVFWHVFAESQRLAYAEGLNDERRMDCPIRRLHLRKHPGSRLDGLDAVDGTADRMQSALILPPPGQ